MKRLAPLLVACALLSVCESPIPVLIEEVPPPVGQGSTAILLVGTALNVSEEMIRDRLSQRGFRVVTMDDDRFSIPSDCAVVVMSKTVSADKIGSRLKPVRCGILFWEDNQQKLDMLATINNDGSRGTAWHSIRGEVIVDARAPTELHAGLSGTVPLYTQPDEITWAPDGELPPAATVVAILGEPSKGRTAIYLYRAGDPLADGTPAAGRRIYFGLYNDTFQLLTPAGLALFDAAVAWAAGR